MRFFIVLLFLSLITVSSTAQEPSRPVRVIVALDAPTLGINDSTRAVNVRAAQEGLLRTLRSAGVTVHDSTAFVYIPFIALTVDSRAADSLARMPQVIGVYPDRPAIPQLDIAAAQVGAGGLDGVWTMNYRGQGQTLAVLDSGVARLHPALNGRVISEACFSTNGIVYGSDGTPSQITSLCKGRVDSAYGEGMGAPCSRTLTNCEHGTMVAGAAASADGLYRGIAPTARIVSVKLFSKVTGSHCPNDWGMYSPCILAFESDQIRALEYVYSQRDTLSIDAVILSLGAGFWADQSQCDADNAPRKAIVDLLASAGIPTFSPTGNAALVGQMLAPACISSVVSVGAVNGADAVARFSDVATFMDFFAPGAGIDVPVLGNVFARKSGTSLATPMVAAGYAILKQALPDVPMQTRLDLLRTSGKPISVTTLGGLTVPRLDLKAALAGQVAAPLKPINRAVAPMPLTLAWRDNGATQYTLAIRDSVTKVIVYQQVVAATCAEGVCRFSPSRAFVRNRVYTWWIVAHMPSGDRPTPAAAFIAGKP